MSGITAKTPIEYLPGIGAERAKIIKSIAGLATAEDFLNFFPIRYLDKSKVHKISELQPENLAEIQLQGKISYIKEIGEGKSRRLTAKFYDGTGSIELVWFRNIKKLAQIIPQDREILIFGKPNFFNGNFSLPHPEIEVPDNKSVDKGLQPIYPSSEKLTKIGINQKFYRKTIGKILENIDALAEENLPDSVLKNYRLAARKSAFVHIHFPPNQAAAFQAERRLKFEEAFFFYLSGALRKIRNKAKNPGNPFPLVGDFFNDFYERKLPFSLTEAQKKVLKEIRTDMKLPVQMNRLLQGDVGSGKTIVALLSMLIALDNGFQSVIMAPTEILARQHFTGISELLKDTGIGVNILTGSTKNSERKIIFENLRSGSLPILVGTHAVLENPVVFKNLGLAIIDEQHRFGVAQRAKLWAKNSIPPHILVMTATPIPRTLAMSFYSDLDVSVIDQLPAGRKPIITAHRREKDRVSVYNFAKEEILKGRQIYFVYPLIEESETLDYRNLMDGFSHISEFFKDFNVTMVHGKMAAADKDANMQYFASGKAQILVSTTVIEVGVNVPNASVMIIESAERFGLSQLHQLRGRVGRGAEQSFCILMTSDKLSADSRTRIKTMCETNDGFKISEVDMQLRGPGDILGTRQSGTLDFKKLDLVADSEIIAAAKKIVDEILEKDPMLSFSENLPVKNYYLKAFRKRTSWGKIS